MSDSRYTTSAQVQNSPAQRMVSPTISALVAAHHHSRAELIATERSLRHDYAFRQSLTPTARRACDIVRKIRDWEAETIWVKEAQVCNPEEGNHDAGEVFPGMVFTLAKARMEQTDLWSIVKRMPKGALLHAHLEAMVDGECLMRFRVLCYLGTWCRDIDAEVY